MDNEKIKKAIDKFEEDEFVASKEILQAEISKAKENYFKDKLGLKGDKKEELVDDEPDIEDEKEED